MMNFSNERETQGVQKKRGNSILDLRDFSIFRSIMLYIQQAQLHNSNLHESLLFVPGLKIFIARKPVAFWHQNRQRIAPLHYGYRIEIEG
jgi:hypothetical protein